jgi:hypothetical protein
MIDGLTTFQKKILSILQLIEEIYGFLFKDSLPYTFCNHLK